MSDERNRTLLPNGCRMEADIMAYFTPGKGTVVKLQSRAPVKKYWSPDEREPLKLTGSLSVKDRATLADPPYITILQAPFGAGKSTICHHLCKMSVGLHCPKGMSTAWHPGLVNMATEKNMWKWAETNEATLESTIVGISPRAPYDEWKYWGETLGVAPPRYEELVAVIEDLIACFWVQPMTKCMRVARETDLDLFLELSPPHAEQFIRWLATFAGIEAVTRRVTVVHINTPVKVRTSRINKRYLEHPSGKGEGYDDIVRRVRIVEGASMPRAVPNVPYHVHQIDNGRERTETELIELAHKVGSIIEQKHAAGR